MRVVICARSPPTSSAVGVWIFGAVSPGRGIASNWPTTALGSSVPLISPSSLDQGRDPPLAVAGEVDLGRVDDAGRVGVVAGRLGAEGGLGHEAFDRRREGADRRLVERLRLGLRHLGLCCPTSISPRARPAACGRSRGRLRRRRSGCGRVRRRRTGSGSRPCRRPSRPARRPVRRGRRPPSAPRAGSCLRVPGTRSSAAPGGSRRSRRAERSSRSNPSRRRSRRRSAARRAGRQRPGRGEGRRASAACYSDGRLDR